MDVLIFENNDYKLIVSTSSIEYSWERFERRVKDNAHKYCDYESTHEGVLSLLVCSEHKSNMIEQNAGNSSTKWPELPPVLFETCEYQFAVELFNLSPTKNEHQKPHVCHQVKEINNNFKFYSTGLHSGILVGSINFLNNPGKFDFTFKYINHEGIIIKPTLHLYVASPKMDTKRDLHEIITLINNEYENYVFNYLTLTFSSFELEKTKKNNKIVWFSIFRSVIESYFRNVNYVILRPNNRTQKTVYYSHPDRIKRWSCQQEERYVDYGLDADKFLYRNERIENTFNTKENRFVKHTLSVLGKKFKEVFGEIRTLYTELDDEEKKQLDNFNKLFNSTINNSFFRKVGSFEGFRQESSILQQRNGYSHIYKSWLMLKSGLDLLEGMTDIGMKKIWELYEIWCFLIMKQLISKILEIDLGDTEDVKKYVKEDKEPMLNSIENSCMSHKVEFLNRFSGDIVCLEYQHTYNRKSSLTKTITTEQRPDIVLTITKPNGFVLTYLYDAKYRVLDDNKDTDIDEGVNIDIADYPLPDAINQMHRYRDAIYYSMSDGVRPDAKEIIGGYILFPGRAFGDTIKDRYFYKSIEKVNIGAFPLLPADPENSSDLIQCSLLYEFLKNILLNPEVRYHVQNSIPQKGLYYVDKDMAKDINGKVYVGYVSKGEDNLQEFIEHRATYYKLTKIPSSNLLNTRFLVPMVKGMVDGMYQVTGVSVLDGKLILKLGTFTSFGEKKANFFSKIKPTEFFNVEEVREIYQSIVVES